MSQPISQVLLTIPKILQDEIITKSGIKFFKNPDYNREWNATVVATIAALPIKATPQEQKILKNLKVGDEVAVSYQIVSELSFPSDGENFMPCTEGDDRMREFRNGRGDWMRVYQLPKQSGWTPLWVGVVQNKFKEIISGAQGDQATVERWMTQFPFDKIDSYTFNNFFEYNKNDYWKCGVDQIFAKKSKGKLIAIGNRVICTPIDEDVPAAALPTTLSLNHSVKIRHQDRAKVLTGGEQYGFKKGDTVHFDFKKLEKYEFWGKDYYLIRNDLILGKWSKN